MRRGRFTHGAAGSLGYDGGIEDRRGLGNRERVYGACGEIDGRPVVGKVEERLSIGNGDGQTGRLEHYDLAFIQGGDGEGWGK